MTSSVPILVRNAVGLVCMVTWLVYLWWASNIYRQILDKVNARLPEDAKFRPLFWGPLKKVRLRDEYRRLYPEGNDLKQLRWLTVIGISAIIVLLITQIL